MSFTPNNRNITTNSIDTPDYVPNPQGDPTGYDTGRRYKSPRRNRIPFGVFLIGSFITLLIVGFVCYRLAGWLSDEYMYNSTFAWLVQLVLYIIVVSVGITAAVSLLSLAFGALGWSLKRHIAELPGGTPVAAFDIVAGWKRDSSANMASGMMNRHFDVQDRLAANSQFRNVTAFSPSTNYSYSVKPDPRQLEGTHAQLLPPADVPPLAELLDSGRVGPDAPLLFGIDLSSGEPITGNWSDLYSTGLGGVQGSGKTWTAVSLLAQSALHQGKLIICDPHAGDAESLAQRIAPLAPAFLCDVAEDDRAILQSLELAYDELERRKRGHADRSQIIVAIDEWSSLRRGELAHKLPLYVEAFSTEGRKLGVNCMLLGQRWDKRSVGEFRNTLTSSYVHRMRADEARMLTGFPAGILPNDTLTLQPGQSYFVNTRGSICHLATPYTTAADIATIARRLTEPLTNPRLSDDRPMGFQRPSVRQESVIEQSKNSHSATLDDSASERHIVNTPEAARIVALFLEGKDAGAIVAEVFGLTNKAGKPYMVKLAEVQAVIRAALAARVAG